MLKEVESTRQEDPLRHRRWFADDFFDLIVWYDPDGRLDGFQLCYNKSFDEHAFTWRRNSGFIHQRIDDGESVPTKKKSPILVPDGQFPCADIRERFETNGREMDPKIVRLVTQKLEEFVQGRKPTPPGRSTFLPPPSSPDQHENNDRPSETKGVQQPASMTAKKSIVRKGFLVFLTVMGMIGLLWVYIWRISEQNVALIYKQLNERNNSCNPTQPAKTSPHGNPPQRARDKITDTFFSSSKALPSLQNLAKNQSPVSVISSQSQSGNVLSSASFNSPFATYDKKFIAKISARWKLLPGKKYYGTIVPENLSSFGKQFCHLLFQAGAEVFMTLLNAETHITFRQQLLRQQGVKLKSIIVCLPLNAHQFCQRRQVAHFAKRGWISPEISNVGLMPSADFPPIPGGIHNLIICAQEQLGCLETAETFRESLNLNDLAQFLSQIMRPHPDAALQASHLMRMQGPPESFSIFALTFRYVKGHHTPSCIPLLLPAV